MIASESAAPKMTFAALVAVGLTLATGNGSPATTPAAFEWFEYEPLGP